MRIHVALHVTIMTLVMGLAGSYTAFAAVPPTNSLSANGVLDEVVVEGTRLWKLRAAIIEAEDRLLARYNDLNRDDDFDIRCVTDTPTGTHLSHRRCVTLLQERARRRDANVYIAWLGDTIIPPHLLEVEVHSGAPLPMLEGPTILQERADDFRSNLIALLQEHPELRRLAKQHGDAQRRYEAALKRKSAQVTSTLAR